MPHDREYQIYGNYRGGGRHKVRITPAPFVMGGTVRYGSSIFVDVLVDLVAMHFSC